MNINNIITAMLNILDPIGVVEIGPKDEYVTEANKISRMLKDQNYIEIENCLKNLYVTEKSCESFKIKEFILVLQEIVISETKK